MNTRMGQLKRIVVGHDLQAGGEVAVRSAAVVAERCSAALKLVHVAEPHPFSGKISHPSIPPCSLAEISQEAREELEALAASPELAHLRTECEVRTGKPSIELANTCRDWQGDLLVVGSTAGEEGYFLGSTGERVLRKALVPVMVAKEPLTFASKILLVPTDFSPGAEKAAEEALYLAKSFDGRVLFFHAFAEDQAAPAIVHQAEESQADLIVMAAHSKSSLVRRLLGSVTEQVVRAAACPVLTIRPEAFEFAGPSLPSRG